MKHKVYDMELIPWGTLKMDRLIDGYTVDILCAWCGDLLGKKRGFKTPEPTHSICRSCFHDLGIGGD